MKRPQDKQVVNSPRTDKPAPSCKKVHYFASYQCDGNKGLHVSAVHAVITAGDDNIRVTTDASASELNDATDMAGVKAALGDFNLPSLRSLASMLTRARRDGRTQLYKTDVSGAFTTMRLSPIAALLQAVQVGEYVLIPLVSILGLSRTTSSQAP